MTFEAEPQSPELEATADRSGEDAIAPSEPGFFTRWRRMVWQTGAERESERAASVRELSVMLELYPDTPSLYLVRGELFYRRKDYALAKSDFQRAVDLAESDLSQKDWAIIDQAVADRARQWLKTLD